MIGKIKFFYLFLLLTFGLTKIYGNEQITNLISDLTSEKKKAFEFFSNAILNSEASYVLFGHKPMCTVGFNRVPCKIFHQPTEFQVANFLQELYIDPMNKKYPFIVSENNIYFVNRDLFIKAVNNNLFLFRYILGSTLTAENILEEFLKSSDGIADVLKYNKLLIGILLGYGTQNSLLVSRMEDIGCELADDRIFFPFKDYETFIGYQRSPSLGFFDLEQEQKYILNLCQISCHLKCFDSFQIPYFGCESQSEETLQLLSVYEKDRENIINILDKGDGLSKLLERICTTTSNEIVVPSKLTSIDDNTDNQKVLDCIIEDTLKDSKLCINSFVDGVLSKNKNAIYTPVDWVENWPYRYDEFAIYAPEDIYEQCVEDEEAKKMLSSISKQKSMIELVKGAIYYKILLKGKGKRASLKTKNATFQFSLYDDDGIFIEAGTLKKTDLNHLVSGIANSIIGMQRGEEREIYMHPKYHRRGQQFLLCKTHLKLLDFEDGNQDVMIQLPRTNIITAENIDGFKKEYKKIMEDRYFSRGYYLWELMQEHDIQISVDEFIKRLKNGTISSSFANEDEKMRFITNFNNRLLMQNIEQMNPKGVFYF